MNRYQRGEDPGVGAGHDVPHDDKLRGEMAINLANHQVKRFELEGRRHAAVAIVVIDSDADKHGADNTSFDRKSMIAANSDDPRLTGRVDGSAGGSSIILTRRSSRLNSHPNQWALPGGRVDGDETAVEAAIRETSEEIGLSLTADNLLGRLDDYPTRSGYVISPFVFWADQDAEPVANPVEVASIHRISLRELMRPDSPRFVSIPQSDRPVIQLPIGGDLVHAPTGAVVYQFRAVAVDGSPVRVHQFEQPTFAWR